MPSARLYYHSARIAEYINKRFYDVFGVIAIVIRGKKYHADISRQLGEHIRECVKVMSVICREVQCACKIFVRVFLVGEIRCVKRDYFHI